MGYRVEYGSVRKVRDAYKRKSHAGALTGLCLLLFFLLVGQHWPKGAAALKGLLIPERAAVAASAMENMAQDLENGAPLGGAMQKFLHEVLGGTGDS